jgi:hypothetical protein
MVLMTTAIIHWDSLLILTAAMNQVRHFEAFTFFCMCVCICRDHEFVENFTSSTLKTVESRPNILWMTVVYN